MAQDPNEEACSCLGAAGRDRKCFCSGLAVDALSGPPLPPELPQGSPFLCVLLLILLSVPCSGALEQPDTSFLSSV